MLRQILGAMTAMLLTMGVAFAQTCTTTVPNNLTNGTNADATAVMGNFNNLSTCVASAANPQTFTPVLNFSGSTTGLVYAASGRYVKIGQLVLAEALITVTAIGSSSGTVTITNLPATNYDFVGAVSVPYYSGFTNAPPGSTSVGAYIQTVSGTAFLTFPNASTFAQMNATNFNPTGVTQFLIAFFYIAQ